MKAPQPRRVDQIADVDLVHRFPGRMARQQHGATTTWRDQRIDHAADAVNFDADFVADGRVAISPDAWAKLVAACFAWVINGYKLVPRFRSSPAFAAPLMRPSESKGALTTL